MPVKARVFSFGCNFGLISVSLSLRVAIQNLCEVENEMRSVSLDHRGTADEVLRKISDCLAALGLRERINPLPFLETLLCVARERPSAAPEEWMLDARVRQGLRSEGHAPMDPWEEVACPLCSGKRYDREGSCRLCRGEGVVSRTRKWKFLIDPQSTLESESGVGARLHVVK